MKQWIYAVCLGLSLLLLGGCGDNEMPVSDPSSEPVWEASLPETLDMERVLTTEEVSTAMETAMGEPSRLDGGSCLEFRSANQETVVTLLIEEMLGGSPKIYEATIAQYPAGTLVETPNLGESAYWCSETGELLLYEDGFMVSVNVRKDGEDSERLLNAARQMAALVLERLQ